MAIQNDDPYCPIFVDIPAFTTSAVSTELMKVPTIPNQRLTLQLTSLKFNNGTNNNVVLPNYWPNWMTFSQSTGYSYTSWFKVDLRYVTPEQAGLYEFRLKAVLPEGIVSSEMSVFIRVNNPSLVSATTGIPFSAAATYTVYGESDNSALTAYYLTCYSVSDFSFWAGVSVPGITLYKKS